MSKSVIFQTHLVTKAMKVARQKELKQESGSGSDHNESKMLSGDSFVAFAF